MQARGKNYDISGGGGGGAGKAVGAVQASRAWGYEERQRRDEAAGILESEEMVMWIAGVRNEVCFFPFSLISWKERAFSLLDLKVGRVD